MIVKAVTFDKNIQNKLSLGQNFSRQKPINRVILTNGEDYKTRKKSINTVNPVNSQDHKSRLTYGAPHRR